MRIDIRLTAALAAVWAASAGAQSITVRTDDRIELLSIVFHLAGSPVYNQGRVPSYTRDVDSTFAPFRDQAAVRRARTFMDSLGINFDQPMAFALRLTDARGLHEVIPIDAARLGWHWPSGSGRVFLDDLRAFVHDAPADEFFRAHAAMYDSATRRMRRLVDSAVDVSWFGRYFGRPPANSFMVVPALLNGGANYGPAAELTNGSLQYYAIIGIDKVDSAGWPAVDTSYVPTIIHEFSHSFVNPAMARHELEFAESGPAVLAAVKQLMKDQAYADWQTVLNESIVRVSVARYRRSHNGPAAGLAEVAEQRAIGFLWMPDLYALFDAYADGRGSYPDLESFVPRIAAFWRTLPARLPALVARYDSARPGIVRIAPADGEADVDPAVTALTIQFNRPMRNGWSLNPFRSDTSDHFPVNTATQPVYDSTHTVFTVPIKLQSGQSYAIVLGRGFRSAEGVPLPRTVIRFQTR
jgi:Domain of unknown function (DUF4932)/Bacterial Ig-like domain